MDIGIDLGTTFSVLAVNGRVTLAADYGQEAIYLDECDVTIIPTPYGEPTYPSVVIDHPDRDGDQLYGADALQRAEEGHAPVMFSKRKIGTRETIPMRGREVVAREVARDFLRYLKECAEKALGTPVSRAVVTHPAYFDRGAVEETRQAAEEAGFDMTLPEQMLMEPVAAALAYTRTDRRDPLKILTYDLGGGTFDVTYLERVGGVIEMRAFDGDHLLGGYNFDRDLAHWLRKRLESRNRQVSFDESDPTDRGRLMKLLRIAEQVKIALAKAPTDTTPVEFRIRGELVDTVGKAVQANERITRRDFVDLIQPYLGRTVDACRRALAKAGVQPEELDEILLVGGSTYGPWVASAMEAAFPGRQPKQFCPDLCVGAGAAIHAKMALPPLIAGTRYCLVLEVPETVALPALNVLGQVTGANGERPSEQLAVTLRLPGGESLGPAALQGDGRFLFAEIELSADQPNDFSLSVTSPGGATVLKHPFRVVYAPEITETSLVSTVLPRPLYVETLDGLAPLAAEGVPLPARCERTFQRQNDNPNISLRLFQEADPIGEIRIENIPAEGGRGSYVDLKVEVTAKNEICGTARIRTPQGRVVAEYPVGVHFDKPEVPPAELLYDRFLALQGEFERVVAHDDERRGDVVTAGSEFIREIDRLFEQQPLERAEIEVGLHKLQNLLAPPEDEMTPSRRLFTQVLERCRKAIVQLEEKSTKVLEESRSAAAVEVDLAAAAVARKNLPRAGQLRELISRLEHEGQAAYQRKDRRAWARIFEALTDVDVRLQERPKQAECPPTIVSKFVASMEVMRHVGGLKQQAARLGHQGRFDDWHGEFELIQRGLQGVLEEIQAIDDEVPGEQGRAMIQRVFARTLQPLQQAIARLGLDVSHVE